MNRLPLIALTIILAACETPQPAPTETVDARIPIAVQYVGATQLDVRKTANESAEVIATYPNGEAISVLARNGEWTEVRTGDRSGWVRTADLIDAATAKAQEDEPAIRFRRAPMPVSASGVRGEIYLEANVNSDGDVTDVRTITNTTGSQALLDRNIEVLRQAKFEPIMRKGQRKGFKYYHRATY